MEFVRVFFRRLVSYARHVPGHNFCVLALLPATAGAAMADSGFDQAHGRTLGAAHEMADPVVADRRLPTLMPDRSDGTARYESGDLTQTRRTASQQPVPPYVPPTFSDLYSVTWEEIPMPDSTPLDPHIITADSINNDGTIAGRGTDAIVLWHPATQAWEEIPKGHNGRSVFISPDGSSIVTTDVLQMPATNILAWNRVDGWQALAGSAVDQSEAYNVSKNFRFVVGAGNNNGEAAQAWVWAIDGGVQQLLPTPDFDGVVASEAEAVSNDGNVVIGNALRPAQSDDGFSWLDYIATRWMAGEPPTILRDPDGNELYEAAACNADCSIVFGTGVWFLKNDGEFGFLGTLPDGYPSPGPYGAYYVTDASSDGSMIVGLYSANLYPTDPNSQSYVERPFIWTRETGMTSVRSLDIGDDRWKSIETVRLSPDARRILISGTHSAASYEWERSRVVVLHLTPKPVSPTAGHSTHAMPAPPRPASDGSLRTGSRLD